MMKRTNFLMIAASVAFIVVGLLLMRPPIDIKSTPNGRYTQAPGPGAFEPIRIKVAPVVCWVGFMLVPFGIMYGMNSLSRTENHASKRGITTQSEPILPLKPKNKKL